MSATRAFYVVQGSLQVWEQNMSEGVEPLTFTDSDDGLQQFNQYMHGSAGQQSLVLIDVIEEVFSSDTVPKLGTRDRQTLLKKRVERKFPRTPYRLPVLETTGILAQGERAVVYSCISNHELLNPWLDIIMRHRTPLTGIFSVPLMAPGILAKFHKSKGSMLFITQHQGNRIRQVFIQDGLVKSARLSQSPQITDEAYPSSVITEIQRSRKYLERTRLLSGMEQLDVWMIADSEVAHKIVDCAETDSPMKLHFLNPASALKKTRAGRECAADSMEGLYIACALKSRPGHSYAASGETRYWHMSRIRRSIIASTIAVATACSVAGGVIIADALRLKSESTRIDAQVSQLSETFRRENADFGPIKADSYEMKLAVDTGDYILDQRLPVPWVMQQLGSVLGDYPDVQVRALSWRSETETLAEPPRARPGEPALPVPIPAINAVSAELTGTLEPFDGDMRAAFSRIDALAADISARTRFADVWTVEYPLDASLRSSIQGEISPEIMEEEARFKLRLVYSLSPGESTGVTDDEA